MAFGLGNGLSTMTPKEGEQEEGGEGRKRRRREDRFEFSKLKNLCFTVHHRNCQSLVSSGYQLDLELSRRHTSRYIWSVSREVSLVMETVPECGQR